MMGCQLEEGTDKDDDDQWQGEEAFPWGRRRGSDTEGGAGAGGVNETPADGGRKTKWNERRKLRGGRRQSGPPPADAPVLIVDLVAEARRVDDRQLHGHALLLDVCTRRETRTG